MAILLKGAPAAAVLNEQTAAKCAALKEKGIVPTLAILRVGARDGDLSYERGAMKRCDQLGVEVKRIVLPADVERDVFFATLESLNRDETLHGILMLRPLPKHLDGERARKMLAPEKDVDGCTDGSLAGVFTNTALGFPPCTAQAAMEILKYYKIPLSGKRAAVIGRSLVVGRPAAMMLMHENATVTVCHTRTVDLPSVVREADIVIAASGQMESLGVECLREGQTVVDVGISWNEAKQKLCGDVLFEEAEPLVAAITPVPGGVGAVTTSVLVSHVVEAAKRAAECT
ncbi:MAG: bifunctional 5,10-methylenetetrahydrofolate dehydrogenase/5,10-methenyltetrahydrofolate cyclohydrolase [Lachnospiraceae bacterium]|nr:bifunctional 5,10-methylenetetrahydrofolate dehydrogenase/5,10-methenyltetrahydrofolate cyclohydrolase [Lachnospiraceae bacterium]